MADPRPHVIRSPFQEEDALDVKYAGFEHSENSRTYLFSVRRNRENADLNSVSADLALLSARRIAIQEAPKICEVKLIARLKENAEGPYCIEGEDLDAFLRPRILAQQRRERRKVPKAPQAGKVSPWHRQ